MAQCLSNNLKDCSGESLNVGIRALASTGDVYIALFIMSNDGLVNSIGNVKVVPRCIVTLRITVSIWLVFAILDASLTERLPCPGFFVVVGAYSL